MKRLRDESAEDALLARGIDMVRSTAATSPMPMARRRVWAAIEYQAGRARMRTPRLSRLRAFALIAALVLLGGTAGAVIGHRRMGDLMGRFLNPVRPNASGEGSSARPRPRPRRTASRDATPRAVAPAPDAEAPAASELVPAPSGAQRHRARTRSSRIVEAELAPSPATLRDGQVLDAMVALRRDHDAARAQDLLARYLAGPSRGALREEALVLSIEAAEARGDGPRVDTLVQQYRASYPKGRFRSFIDDRVKRP
jgi:hypothetical protein